MGKPGLCPYPRLPRRPKNSLYQSHDYPEGWGWVQVVSRWEFAEDIGKLPDGFYFVEANINGAVSKAEFKVLTNQPLSQL